jgi:putative ABC transport system substrate-binding protein
VSRIAVLLNPDNPAWHDYPNALNGAADQLRLVLIGIEARGAVDIDRTLARSEADGLLLVADSTLAGDQSVSTRIARFARERRLPSASIGTNFARDGGLLSLGTERGFPARRAAEYVHRIILGAQPSELPVEGPAKFQLSVNLDTAKALGLTVPQTLLGRADEVIE